MGLFSGIRRLFTRRKPTAPSAPVSHSFKYEGQQISVDIHEANNFSESDLAHFKLAIEIMVNVVNSEEFKDSVLHPPRLLEETKGMSNEEIYNLFMSGRTELDNKPDKDIDIYINMYYKWGSTIGYTYPSTLSTWINRRFFWSMGEGGIVGNIVHEYLHKCGFSHASRGYTRREVPYYYGQVAEFWANKMLNGYALTPLAKSTN